MGMPVRLGASMVAEFIGAFALSFIGLMAIAHSGGPGGGGLLAIALAHGIILAIAVTATMPTSGGHLNPAVTFGFLITGKIKPGAAIAYMIAQLLGGLAAALAVYVIFGHDEKAAAIVASGTPHLGTNTDAMLGCLAEIIATFFLVFAVWGTAADPRAKQVGGFAIGLTIAADILAIGPITGAAMNPSRVLGPAIIGSLAKDTGVWNGHWIYWVGAFIGAGIAALVYHMVLWPRDMAGREAKAVDVPPTQRP
jgi:aquaporin TIP